MNLDPKTPVLVGAGAVMQREEDPQEAVEASALMVNALQKAAENAGSRDLLAAADSVRVPQGFWQYSDPGRLIADRAGAVAARTVLAKVGVMQQTLISDACKSIAAGEERIALVTGGEARYRTQRAKITGREISDTLQTDSEPDETLNADDNVWADIEFERGLFMPVHFFSLIENAMRFHRGLTLDTHRDEIAEMWAGFSKVAASNPHAWVRSRVSAEQIRNPSAKNRMLAFPYTKLHSSQWNVDQAAGLILCSVEAARAHGIPRERWVFPLAATESNHLVHVSARAQIHRCPGIAIAGGRALDLAERSVDTLTHVDLYSCFPAPVRLFARELGLNLEHSPTVTGGMAFAGGPLNNYVLQATARMADILRSDPGATGLVTCISGFINKHGYGVWSTQPPARGFQFVDVSSEVASATESRELLANYEGPATVAAYTVIYSGEEPSQGIAICDLPNGARTVANTNDPALCSVMTTQEYCGRNVLVRSGGKLSDTEGRGGGQRS